MASDLSKYLGNKLAMWIAGNAMPAAPANIYLAIYNGDPKGAGTEVTTTIRSAGRLPVDWDAIVSGIDNILVNEADVDYGDAEGATSMSHVAAVDAASGGNILASKAIPGGTVAIELGTGVKFLAGDVSFTLGS